jgi:hypothetical protein
MFTLCIHRESIGSFQNALHNQEARGLLFRWSWEEQVDCEIRRRRGLGEFTHSRVWSCDRLGIVRMFGFLYGIYMICSQCTDMPLPVTPKDINSNSTGYEHNDNEEIYICTGDLQTRKLQSITCV